MKTLFAASLFSLLGATICAPLANAGEALAIQVDESRIMTLSGTPGAIIVGNPSIADVSIQGQQLFVHGRGFGQTNLTILDLQGNQIANFDMMVTHTQVSNVALFRGINRYSYSCAPFCEAEIQIGDETGHVDGLISVYGKKIELATGSKTAEAQAPQAPQ
jgi:hypothetical protein